MASALVLAIPEVKGQARWMKDLLRRLTSAFGRTRPPANLGTEQPEKPIPAGSQTSGETKFEPANELEHMLVAATAEPAKRIAFQKMLLKADLCAATPDPPDKEGWRTTETDEVMRLLSATAPDGSSPTAIFTSESRVAEAFGPHVGFVKMQGEILLDLIADSGAILNPGLPYSVHWTPTNLSTVLGRPVRRTVAKDTTVMLGVPAEPPENLLAALRGALGSETHIKEAWLALAHWPEENTSSWYLDVRTDLQAEEVNGMLSDLFATADFGGRPLDLVVNPIGGEVGAGIRVAPAQVH